MSTDKEVFLKELISISLYIYIYIVVIEPNIFPKKYWIAKKKKNNDCYICTKDNNCYVIKKLEKKSNI